MSASDYDRSALIAELRRDEGFVPHAYTDSLGYWTIGVGRLIDRRKGGGISQAEADCLLNNDINCIEHDLDMIFPAWRELDPVRQRVMLNMCFNLGANGLKQFRQTLAYVRAGEYERAATQMLKSLWAKQVGQRAVRLATMMRIGSVNERTGG